MSARAMPRRGARLWVYKVRLHGGDPNRAASGDWYDLFSGGSPDQWGGSWATRDRRSLEILDHEMRPGDLILAYQTDLQSAVGVALIDSITGVEGSKLLYLDPVELFPQPLPLHKMKRTTHVYLQKVEALKPGRVATFYETKAREAYLLLYACGSRFSSVFKAAAGP